MQNLWQRINHNSFIKSVSMLSAGTLIAQAIIFLFSPIISRIYLPEELGDYSIFTSTASILCIISALGLMTAIMVPKEDEDSKKICTSILYSVSFLSLILFAVLSLLSNHWRIFQINGSYLVACLLFSCYIILYNLHAVTTAYINRKKTYRVLFIAYIIRSISQVSICILLGLLGMGSIGYILGVLCGELVSLGYMLLHKNPFKLTMGITRFIQTLRHHGRFVQYQLPANVIGAFSLQMPVQMLSRLFGSTVLGAYSMTVRILQLPSIVLSSPINLVFYRDANALYQEGKDIGNFSFKIMEKSIQIAILPISILSCFGSSIFAFVLGEPWRIAGQYASILGIYYLLSFCSNCMSGGLVIIRKQNLNLVFSILSLVINSIIFPVARHLFQSVEAVLLSFSLCNVLLRVVQLTIFFHGTGVSLHRCVKFFIVYICLPMVLCEILRRIIYL